MGPVRLALVVAVTLALAVPGRAGEPLPPESRRAAEALRDRALAEGRAAEWARRLTDEVGPRLAGSAGDRAAVAWGVALFRELGFSGVKAEPVPVKVWTRGAETGEIVAPFPQRLVLTALGGSVPTPDGGLEALVVKVGSLEELERRAAEAPDAFRGRIVFIDRRTERTGSGMAGYGTTVTVRTTGAAKAAAHGAVGVLIRSIGTDSNRLPHTGVMEYAEGVPKVPAAALSGPDADLLARTLETGRPVRVRFVLGCHDEADGVSANVIGDVPGRGRPDEIVLLGCHLDSWDLGTGAIDDAAGCGIVIETARLVAASPRRPLRTVRVVLFADEEKGGAGGRAYPRAHAAELPRHVAAFEADSGTGRPLGLGWTAGPGAEPFLAKVAELLAPLGAGRLSPGGGGADVSPLRDAGVPLLGLGQETTTYFDVHHTANDTFDKIDPDALAKDAAALAAAVYAVADAPAPLPRIPSKAP